MQTDNRENFLDSNTVAAKIFTIQSDVGAKSSSQCLSLVYMHEAAILIPPNSIAGSYVFVCAFVFLYLCDVNKISHEPLERFNEMYSTESNYCMHIYNRIAWFKMAAVANWPQI